MKYFNLVILCLVSLCLFSCEEDVKDQQAQLLKVQRYNDSIVKIISKNWNLSVPSPTPKVQQLTTRWNEWHQFRDELAKKPNANLAAYRQKAQSLAEKAEALNNNIPAIFDMPHVRSRIAVLNTKARSLYTYINVDVAQDEKVIDLLKEITRETISIQNQFDEAVRRLEVPKEFGEDEMLRALDTVRMANPDAMRP